MFTAEQKSIWMANRRKSQEEILAELPEAVKPYAFKVGSWVWLEMPDKPDADTLTEIKALGFKWNPKRMAWQHPCGRFCKKAPYDPRGKYGSIKAYDDEKAVA